MIVAGSALVLSYYAEISFIIMSINEMYSINTTDSSFDKVQNKMVVSFCHRIRLITGCCPNKSMKRMVEKGNRLLERELDLLDILKRGKHHHKLLKEHPSH